jgi:hypothetical protein
MDAFAASASDSSPSRIEIAERAIAIRLTDLKAPDRDEQIALNEALRALRQLISETEPSSEHTGSEENALPRSALLSS